jgi:hypothetical protein
MLGDFQRGESFIGDLEDRRGFLPHIGFGVMVARLEQFGSLLVA